MYIEKKKKNLQIQEALSCFSDRLVKSCCVQDNRVALVYR